MHERWSDPDTVLGAATRIVSAPRSELLHAVGTELVDLVPHQGLAMRTADCARTPVITTGDPGLRERVTAAELAAVQATSVPGPAVATTATMAGETTRVVTVTSAPDNGRGALLVVLLDRRAPDPSPDVLHRVTALWGLVAAAAAARAESTGPDLLAANRAAATARHQARADLARTQVSGWTALLGVLRSTRRQDSEARAVATALASDALLQLHDVNSDDAELAGTSARAGFDRLAAALDTLVRHLDVAVDLVGPHDDTDLPQDVATGARAISQDLLHTALHRPGTTRVRVCWTVQHDQLHVEVRDDGTPEDTTAPRPAPADELVRALHGTLHVHATPGWGTTTTATLPLRVDVPTAAGPLSALHPRELQVLTGLTAGLRNRDLAAQLHLSEHTVKFHVRNILAKLGVATRGEAAARAHELGLPPPP